jgi:mono/diheme cytochrome c family protein
MRTIILTLLTVLGLAVLASIAFVYSGMYDVSATRPHWPLTYWAMDMVRVQSVKAQAAGVTPPTSMMDEANIIGGTEHFAAHCASCHGAPGVPRGAIANGLYPRPADLADAVKRYTPGELFWIVKNGIKMSGMPAWADHSDEELWGTVAFIEKLPGMSETDYAKLVMESMKQGGHHHHGGDDEKSGDMQGMNHGLMPAMAPASPGGHQH